MDRGGHERGLEADLPLTQTVIGRGFLIDVIHYESWR